MSKRSRELFQLRPKFESEYGKSSEQLNEKEFLCISKLAAKIDNRVA